MRKTLIILAISLISLVASAQGSFKLINDTYNNEKGISIIQLDKELIDLYKRDNISKQDLEILKSIEEVIIKGNAKTYAGEELSISCFSALPTVVNSRNCPSLLLVGLIAERPVR